MGIQVLQFWLLLIALLGLIDKSITTFTNYKDTLNEAINETTRLVNTRKAATMKLEEGRSPRTRGEMIEVGEKIAGDYPGTLKPEIYDEDNGYEIKKNIEERLYMPLYRIQTHNVLKGQPDHGKFRDLVRTLWSHMEFPNPSIEKKGDDLKEQTDHRRFGDVVQTLWNHLPFLNPPIEKITEETEEMGKADHKENLTLIFDNLQKIAQFLDGKMKESPSADVLSGDKSSETELQKNNVQSLFFCISDTVVEYISSLQRHGFLSKDYLKAFLNDEDHWIVLFHYILGKFPETDTIARLFLNYDLQSSLEESPFLEEIHELLKLMNEDSWKKMKHLYLAIQIGSNQTPHYSNDISKNKWEELKSDFFQLIQLDITKNHSSPVQHIFDFEARTILNNFLHYIDDNKLHDHVDQTAEAKRLKIIHTMICSVILYWKEMSPQKNFKNIITHSNFQDLDAGIKRFSDALAVAYHKYGQLSQLSLASKFEQSDDYYEKLGMKKVLESNIADMIFLSNIIKEKGLSDKNIVNNDQIESKRQRGKIDFSPEEDITKNEELEISLKRKQRLQKLHDSWKEDDLPSWNNYLDYLNKSKNILHHLDKEDFKDSLFEGNYQKGYGNESSKSDLSPFSKLDSLSKAIEIYVYKHHHDKTKEKIYRKWGALNILLKDPIDNARRFRYK